MTIRHLASPGDFYFRFLDPSAGETTLPAPTTAGVAWTLFWLMAIDGSLDASTDLQYDWNLGGAGTSNALVAARHANDANKGKVHIYTPSGATGYLSTNAFLAGSYTLFALSADTTNGFRLRSCQVLATRPNDGSAVQLEFVKTLAEAKVDTALDIPGLMTGRSNANNRKSDQSIGRIGCYFGMISDHEFARMAFGMEITELGMVPEWYYRMNDPADITNRGRLSLLMSKVGSGTPAAGSAVPFGYDSSNPPSNEAPTITGKPVIVAGAAANQAATYTRAPVNGIPAPTVTQQWYIEGAPVSSGTGASQMLPADAGGKALQIEQIATSVAGTARSMSDPVTIAAPPANAIAATAMPADAIYQRAAGKLAITMGGTYTGDIPDRIDVQLYDSSGFTVLVPWAAVPSPTISAPVSASGTWAATPVIQQGGMYRRRVRAWRNGAVISIGDIEAETWGVGARGGLIGSSSAQYGFNANGNGGSGFVPRDDVRLRTSTGWEKMTDQGWGVSIANDMAERLGVPVGILGFGVGGSSLAQWSAKGSSFNPFAAAAGMHGVGMEFCIGTVGSNDPPNGTVPSKEVHYQRLKTMIENVWALPGCAGIPYVLSGANNRGSNTQNNLQYNWVREAENDIGAELANVIHVQTLDYPLQDGTHLSKGPAGYPALAKRIDFQLGAFMATGAKLRGPSLVSMVKTGAVIRCKLRHYGSTDYTLPSLDAFKAWAADGVTAIAVTDVARVDASTFDVTCASSDVEFLNYLFGAQPAAATELYGNTAMPLPMTVETEMALTPAGEVVPDTTSPVMTGAISITNITTSGATLSFQAATDDVGVVGYEYSINGGTSYVNAGLSQSFATPPLTAATTYQVRARAYDYAGNRSAPLSASFTTLANEPPAEIVIDASKIPASRKVVFPGGTRVIPFGTKPNSIVPDAPYYRNGKWSIDKVPEDERYYVADFRIDLAEAGSTAAKAEAFVSGVKVLEQPVVQGALIPVKLGGFDELRGALNFCTFRVTLANGEQIDRTLWFSKVDVQWVLEKDPEDKRYYVADVSRDLIDSNTTVSAVTAAAVGVAELVKPQMQGRLAVVKLGGMDTSADPLNYCKLRFDCANGERFFRTIHFKRVDN